MKIGKWCLLGYLLLTALPVQAVESAGEDAKKVAVDTLQQNVYPKITKRAGRYVAFTLKKLIENRAEAPGSYAAPPRIKKESTAAQKGEAITAKVIERHGDGPVSLEMKVDGGTVQVDGQLSWVHVRDAKKEVYSLASDKHRTTLDTLAVRYEGMKGGNPVAASREASQIIVRHRGIFGVFSHRRRSKLQANINNDSASITVGIKVGRVLLPLAWVPTRRSLQKAFFAKEPTSWGNFVGHVKLDAKKK